jgi:hypothetical protein
MARPDAPDLKTPARRLVALLVCRLYAILPCLITPIVAGVLAAFEAGVTLAAILVVASFLLMALRFPDFLERKGAMLVNALFYFAMISLPAAVLPFTGFAGLISGLGIGVILSVGVIAIVPKIPGLRSILQPELFPDVLTGLFLSAAFYLPIRRLRRDPGAPSSLRPPFEVSIILCAYEEEATIDECLASIKVAVSRAVGSPLVKRARVVLVDSSPSDVTRERLTPLVDRVIHGHAGKLSARDQATLMEPADIVVAADGDRRYDPDWLLKLVEPFSDPGVVATMGETRNAGAGMSASALCRAVLKLPYNGGNSAYFRTAYLNAPFEITLDQGRHKELWLEEEFLFGLTLQAQGRVAHVADCRSYELRPYPLLAQLARHLFGVRLRTF